MRIGICLRLSTDDWTTASAYVTEAERLGVNVVWAGEAWGHDAVTPLPFLAARTTRVRLGSGIMQVGSRSPALVAMTAMCLAAMSEGRFVLGLGVSGPQVMEGWHGVPFARPVQRLRETVDIVRAVLRGRRLAYHGQVYAIPLPGGEGWPLQSTACPRPRVPVYLAALSPRSLELTGELADGWLGMSFMPEHRDVFFSHLAVGAARAGRTLDDLDLQAGGTVAFSDDLDRLIPSLKFSLAYTMGAMGSRRHNFYNHAFRRAGYHDTALEVQRLWMNGRWSDAVRRVPDDLVFKTNLVGTRAMVRRRLAAYGAAGITTLRVDPAGDTLDERLAALGELLELVRELRPAAAAATHRPVTAVAG
jgi:F420-dependent oxidoreductase-like protein